MTARLLVSGARVLTPGGEWPRGWIAVEGRRIAALVGDGRVAQLAYVQRLRLILGLLSSQWNHRTRSA